MVTENAGFWLKNDVSEVEHSRVSGTRVNYRGSSHFSCQYSPDERGNQLSDGNECYGKLDGIRRRLTAGFTVLIEKA